MWFKYASTSTAEKQVVVMAATVECVCQTLSEGIGQRYGAFVTSMQFLSAVHGQTFKFLRKKFEKPEVLDANVADG